MFLPAYIGRRVSLRPNAGKGARYGAGTIIAVVGIGLSVAIMLLSISVVKGFKEQICHKVEGFNSQITVYPVDAFSDSLASSGIRLDESLTTVVKQLMPAAQLGISIRQPAVLKTDSAFQGIMLKGSNAVHSAKFLAENISEGDVLPVVSTASDSLVNTMLISRLTASALDLHCGDRVDVHFLRDNSVSTRRLTIRGIYDTHFSDYDKLYAFVPLAFLQRFNRLDSLTGSAVEISGIETAGASELAAKLEQQLLANSIMHSGGQEYVTENVQQTGALYFSWLDLLDTNVAVIIILMTLVSAFTLISSLFIIILDKVQMIGLLKALGATNRQVRGIFIYLAERLVTAGLIAGNIFGLGLISLQEQFHLIPLNPSAYYLSYVPVVIDWGAVVAVNAGAIVISLLVLIAPSSVISRMSPSSTMRFE